MGRLTVYRRLPSASRSHLAVSCAPGMKEDSPSDGIKGSRASTAPKAGVCERLGLTDHRLLTVIRVEVTLSCALADIHRLYGVLVKFVRVPELQTGDERTVVKRCVERSAVEKAGPLLLVGEVSNAVGHGPVLGARHRWRPIC